MFQIIVKGNGWKPNRDSIDRSRVLEHTDDSISERFAPKGNVDPSAVTDIPTLFVTETGGLGEQVGRVGTIARVRAVGRNYQIDYTIDADVPGIPNEKLEQIAAELDIDAFEFQRTHWAIKDRDLFRVLLKHSAAQRPTPKVFRIPEGPLDERLVSVMMPFSAAFDDVYATLKRTVTNLGLRCQRADDIWNDDVIIQDIVSLLCRSSVVVCDLSGKNANVFYETGIAHALGREVILLTQHETDVPFDLRHIRHIRYDNNGAGRERLSVEVKRRLEALAARK